MKIIKKQPYLKYLEYIVSIQQETLNVLIRSAIACNITTSFSEAEKNLRKAITDYENEKIRIKNGGAIYEVLTVEAD